MKHLISLCALSLLLSLTSCNTLIGVWRDTKEGFIWTKNKIQQSSQSSSSSSSNAPVY